MVRGHWPWHPRSILHFKDLICKVGVGDPFCKPTTSPHILLGLTSIPYLSTSVDTAWATRSEHQGMAGGSEKKYSTEDW
jgi:hypothetical protein